MDRNVSGATDQAGPSPDLEERSLVPPTHAPVAEPATPDTPADPDPQLPPLPPTHSPARKATPFRPEPLALDLQAFPQEHIPPDVRDAYLEPGGAPTPQPLGPPPPVAHSDTGAPTGHEPKNHAEKVLSQARQLSTDVVEWVTLRVQLTQMVIEERINERLVTVEKAINVFVKQAVIALTGAVAVLFMLVALALGVGTWLGHPAWGFLGVGIVLLIVTFFVRRLSFVVVDLPEVGQAPGAGPDATPSAAPTAGAPKAPARDASDATSPALPRSGGGGEQKPELPAAHLPEQHSALEAPTRS